MIIIAFSTKTSKFLPRLFCKNFRHCAPIIISGRDADAPYMLQFTAPGRIYKLNMTGDAVKRLQTFGWKMVYTSGALPMNCNVMRAHSCVDLCKRVLQLRAPLIQTPDALYRRIQE